MRPTARQAETSLTQRTSIQTARAKIRGEFIKGHRESVVLATKYSNAAPGKDPNLAGNHRKSMMQALEASLKRLRTDYIDLYWVHIWDGITPVEEVTRGLDDMVRQGKLLYVGISDAPPSARSSNREISRRRQGRRREDDEPGNEGLLS